MNHVDIVGSFIRYLRFERGLYACNEVSNYGCIADILAVDHRKERVIEYEFKQSSHDLKVLEKKKYKYEVKRATVKKGGKWFRVNGHLTPEPHLFYYVVPDLLWDKEKEYLEKQHCGVIIYYEQPNSGRYLRFVVAKKCTIRKSNVQKYNVSLKNLCARLSSAYANTKTCNLKVEVTE